MTSQLVYASNNKADDLSDYIVQQSRGTTSVTFLIKLPKTGLYKLQVYALPFADTSENLPGVFNYLINCISTQVGYLFNYLMNCISTQVCYFPVSLTT